jgi:hypothetical protein
LQLATEPGEGEPPEIGQQGAPGGPADPQAPKTRIVRALLEALEEVELDDEDDEAKKELRRSLLEADGQLSQVLGQNSKRLILDANRKPLVPVIAEPGRQADPRIREVRPSSSSDTEAHPADESSDDRGADPPTATKPSDPSEAPESADEPKTELVQSLLDALEEVETEDEQAREQLRQILRDADRELREAIGPKTNVADPAE